MREQSNRRQLVALNFRVPLDLRRRLKMLAASRSITMTDLLLELLERDGVQPAECAEVPRVPVGSPEQLHTLEARPLLRGIAPGYTDE